MKYFKFMVLVFAVMFVSTTSVDAGLLKKLKKKVTVVKGDDKKEAKEAKEKKEDKEAKNSKEKPKVAVPAKKPNSKYDYETSESGDRDADIKKILPAKSEYTHWITNGVFGPADGSIGSILIVPYIVNNDGKVQLMLLVPQDAENKYKKIMLGTVTFGKNAAQEVLSVFFDQADKDKERELFVLCSYQEGDEYFVETAVYNWNKNKFVRELKLEKKLINLSPAINVRRALRAMEKKPKG
ncbi:MAG: hypothetical protein KAZ87_05680 [Spirochaetes bacterium]|nr:hypothetical protein [Spirochaetota bacterium]